MRFAIRSTFLLAACLSGLLPGLALAGNSWEAAIQDFEIQDRSSPPPRNSIVVVGSSSIGRWSTIATDLAPLDVISRGFGGSTADDLDFFLDRIVLNYAPRAVVIYEGDNDIAVGYTPQAVADRIAAIAARITARFSGTRVYVISVKFSPARAAFAAQFRELNQRLAEVCAHDARYTFINVASALLGSDGQPVASYYAPPDFLHLSTSGYQVWSSVIRSVLLPQQSRPLPVDVGRPTAPTQLQASVVDAAHVNLQWAASSDNTGGVGLAGYRVFRDGQAVATTTATQFADGGLVSNALYSYDVSAFDRAASTANESAHSVSVSVSTPAAGPPPIVTLSAVPSSVPAGGSVQLSWNTQLATRCSGAGLWSGSKVLSGVEQSSTLAANAAFTLTCTGPGGTTTAGTNVTVVAAAAPVVVNPPVVTVPTPTPTPVTPAEVVANPPSSVTIVVNLPVVVPESSVTTPVVTTPVAATTTPVTAPAVAGATSSTPAPASGGGALEWSEIAALLSLAFQRSRSVTLSS